MAAPICARPATAIFLTVASATIGLASQDKLPASRPAVQDVNRLSAGQPSPLEATLLWPTLGRPAFVVPGAELPVRAQMPASDRTPVISLVSAALPRHRHLLRAGAGAPASLAGGRILPVGVPASVPPGTYDLDIRWGSTCAVGRHCVAVGVLPERIRIVHLSNMNVGDVGAADFDRRLIEEVNLVAPTLIVATGDYLDATHPDPVRGWAALVGFLCSFDAPTLLACGDHDDIALYSQTVSPSPIGVVQIGRCRGVVLFDHADHPLEEDAQQLRWAEQVLTEPSDDRLSFIVSHAEEPGLLRHWQRQGRLERMVSAARLGLWFGGGHRDWNGQEWAELVRGAAPMLFLRTHQSSTAALDGAEGISHFRIVDMVGTRAFLMGEAGGGPVPASIPVGRLNARVDGPNDGSCTRLSATVTNNLAHRMDGLALRLLVRPSGDDPPWCHGATLTRVSRIGTVWECRLGFDLPDKGALRAVVGTGPEPPQPDVEVRVTLRGKLRLTEQVDEAGLAYLRVSNLAGFVYVRNRGQQAAELRPLIRLDGDRLPYRPIAASGPFAMAYGLRLQPGEEVPLELELSALRVRPGRRDLQVYLKGGQAWAPICHPLEIEMAAPGPVARVQLPR